MKLLEFITRKHLYNVCKSDTILESEHKNELKKFVSKEATYEQALNLLWNPNRKEKYLEASVLESHAGALILKELCKMGFCSSKSDNPIPINERANFLQNFLNECGCMDRPGGNSHPKLVIIKQLMGKRHSDPMGEHPQEPAVAGAGEYLYGKFKRRDSANRTQVGEAVIKKLVRECFKVAFSKCKTNECRQKYIRCAVSFK